MFASFVPQLGLPGLAVYILMYIIVELGPPPGLTVCIIDLGCSLRLHPHLGSSDLTALYT